MDYVMHTNHKPQAIQVRVKLLTKDEVRHECARQLAINTSRPTRVQGNRVEMLMGDAWVEVLDPALA